MGNKGTGEERKGSTREKIGEQGIRGREEEENKREIGEQGNRRTGEQEKRRLEEQWNRRTEE